MPYLRANANPDEYDVVWSLDIFQDTSVSWFNLVANALIKKDIINKDAIDMPVDEFVDIIFFDYLNSSQSFSSKIKQKALTQYHNINGTNDDRLFFYFRDCYRLCYSGIVFRLAFRIRETIFLVPLFLFYYQL